MKTLLLYRHLLILALVLFIPTHGNSQFNPGAKEYSGYYLDAQENKHLIRKGMLSSVLGKVTFERLILDKTRLTEREIKSANDEMRKEYIAAAKKRRIRFKYLYHGDFKRIEAQTATAKPSPGIPKSNLAVKSPSSKRYVGYLVIGQKKFGVVEEQLSDFSDLLRGIKGNRGRLVLDPAKLSPGKKNKLEKGMLKFSSEANSEQVVFQPLHSGHFRGLNKLVTTTSPPGVDKNIGTLKGQSTEYAGYYTKGDNKILIRDDHIQSVLGAKNYDSLHVDPARAGKRNIVLLRDAMKDPAYTSNRRVIELGSIAQMPVLGSTALASHGQTVATKVNQAIPLKPSFPKALPKKIQQEKVPPVAKATTKPLSKKPDGPILMKHIKPNASQQICLNKYKRAYKKLKSPQKSSFFSLSIDASWRRNQYHQILSLISDENESHLIGSTRKKMRESRKEVLRKWRGIIYRRYRDLAEDYNELKQTGKSDKKLESTFLFYRELVGTGTTDTQKIQHLNAKIPQMLREASASGLLCNTQLGLFTADEISGTLQSDTFAQALVKVRQKKTLWKNMGNQALNYSRDKTAKNFLDEVNQKRLGIYDSTDCEYTDCHSLNYGGVN